MAPTRKSTPRWKWQYTVKPECLQSQALYLLCPTLALKTCRLTLLGWKQKKSEKRRVSFQNNAEKKGTSYFTSIKKKLDNLQNISLLCKKNYSQYMT